MWIRKIDFTSLTVRVAEWIYVRPTINKYIETALLSIEEVIKAIAKELLQ